ncbi:MAG: D-alanine--D-alanine ligase [Elusimicrobiota bacterium]|nr:D-alanine--D-alanine ligase [Elusimicrobiota bacterium]
MRKITNIGIVLETKADALKTGLPLDQLYHWREPGEIAAITGAIKELGFTTVILGTPEDLAAHPVSGVDFIFNLSVGFVNRYRLAAGPALYSLLKLPYSGADPYTKMMSQHKHAMKSFWDKLGIPTPEWAYIHTPGDVRAASLPPFPLILKPAYEGSSIGIDESSVIHSRKSLLTKAEELFSRLKMPMIVERFIAGRECKVGIIGNAETEFSGIIEDICADGSGLGKEMLGFRVKKAGTYSKRTLIAGDALSKRIMKDAKRIYELFRPVDYGTMDVRVDNRGCHYFLEFNADATLHPQRTLAQCCALNGVDYRTMIGKILTTSFKRWGIKQQLPRIKSEGAHHTDKSRRA